MAPTMAPRIQRTVLSYDYTVSSVFPFGFASTFIFLVFVFTLLHPVVLAYVVS